jgi:hypothetical protein
MLCVASIGAISKQLPAKATEASIHAPGRKAFSLRGCKNISAGLGAVEELALACEAQLRMFY